MLLTFYLSPHYITQRFAPSIDETLFRRMHVAIVKWHNRYIRCFSPLKLLHTWHMHICASQAALTESQSQKFNGSWSLEDSVP